MSEENMEIVRALAEGFQHRDHEGAFEFYDPEIEWDNSQQSLLMPDLAGVYHGRHSGIETEFPPYGMVFTLRGGKVVRHRAYPDQKSALEAAGLSE